MTNQPFIVEHARKCYLNCPTIVNNIPKESNKYHNTMDDFALIDNNLSKSQTDIGESSNLAQIAQTYECTFKEQKYSDYVCILSVLAQCAIDNAKRRFDVDLTAEIKRIKKDMDMNIHKYPSFWSIIKKDFNKKNINKDLICPMNYLCELNIEKKRSSDPTIPISYFFIKNKLIADKRNCKKVEELISSYSLDLMECVISDSNDEDFLLLRSDFDNLLNDIQKIHISNNYKGLMSWLIDRAFMITDNVRFNNSKINSKLHKDRAKLLKVLYSVNKKAFLSCFKSG